MRSVEWGIPHSFRDLLKRNGTKQRVKGPIFFCKWDVAKSRKVLFKLLGSSRRPSQSNSMIRNGGIPFLWSCK